MKTPNALALLEFPVAEKAADFSVDVNSADEIAGEFQQAFQPVRPWAKSVADRPTPDDWPVYD